MKDYLANGAKCSRIIISLIISLMATIFLSGCAKELNTNLISCGLEEYSLYPKVIEQILPSFKVELSENKPYYILNDGGITEAFGTQAVGAIEAGIAKHWYPQYLATVIIAVDREQTDAVITTWNDLFSTQQEVGFFNTSGNIQMLTAAMSYGLEGDHFSLTKAIQLLTSLYEDNRLKINSFDSPITICYDYQAATLNENGRNIEIIIPSEGTYTYEKGLLSNDKLDFQNNVDKLLLGANLRLLDGRNNFSRSLDEIDYGCAVKVSNYEYFSKVTQNIKPIFEREVLNSKRYMSIDKREHLLSALIYIIIVTIWATSVLRRSMQKGISYAAFSTGVILNGWTLVRLIKYQISEVSVLNRYLWYSFYVFQLSLPLVLLWMAWAIDKPENETFPPKWWRALVVLIWTLIIFVFTNDLHGFVFHLDLTRLDWAQNYSYGFGYYMILFVCMTNLLAVFIILIQKSIRNPRKRGFIFPLLIFVMFGIYNYKYIMRNNFVYETDLTIITGIFTMLMFESCIWSGLIPVNTKYIELFTRSPLKMQIIRGNREVALASATSMTVNMDILDKVIDSSPMAILEDDFLLFANPVPGGYAVWHEDVSQLNQLYRDIEDSTKMLMEANTILAEEEKIKRSINERVEKKQLMDQLEIEIAESIKQLSMMIEKLPNSENHASETTRIALLLCYIKRRCNLFFQERETDFMNGYELNAYLEELSEIANYSNVQIATINEVKKKITIRHAILFYDFSYTVVDFSVQKNFPNIIQYLGFKDEFLTMGILTSENLEELKLGTRLLVAIKETKGKITKKDLEDAVGINVSFPKGGEVYD